MSCKKLDAKWTTISQMTAFPRFQFNGKEQENIY